MTDAKCEPSPFIMEGCWMEERHPPGYTPPATVAALVEALEGMASAANHENWHLDCVLAKVLSDDTSALAAYREAGR